MRESWTDARLDDFSRHVDERFDRVDAELRHQRTELRQEFIAFRAETSSRLDALQRLTLQIGAGIFATLVMGILAMLAHWAASYV